MLGIIDQHGTMVVPPKFLECADYSEGLAAATIDGKKWGLIDQSGNFVIAPNITITADYLLAAYEMKFHDGLAPVPLPVENH